MTADPRNNDGRRGHVAVLDTSGAVARAIGLREAILASAVSLPGGRALLALGHVVAGDAEGRRRERLRLALFDARAIRRSRTLDAPRLASEPALAAAPDGRAVFAWAAYGDPKPPNEFDGRFELKVLTRDARGRLGRPVVLERTRSADYRHDGDVAAAIGADGTMAVAFATSHRARGRSVGTVDLFTRRPGHRWSRRRTAGPSEGVTRLGLAVGDTGSVLLAWGTQDGGEEANKPWVVRVVSTAAHARALSRPHVLDPGRARERPAGGVRVAIAPDGRRAVLWSGVTGSQFREGHPLRAAFGDRRGRFGAFDELGPGIAGDLVADRRGGFVAAWATPPDYAAMPPIPPTQAITAVAPPGARFGQAAPVGPADFAGGPRLALAADGIPAIAWSARPAGADPAEGVGRTAILRVSRGSL